ncbi:hypothetical protein D3C85_1778470 [compost metagenome]
MQQHANTSEIAAGTGAVGQGQQYQQQRVTTAVTQQQLHVETSLVTLQQLNQPVIGAGHFQAENTRVEPVLLHV